MLAANLKPNEIFLAKYEINSIKTSKGNNAKGQPAGTNKEKNSKPCFWNPSIVAPKTIVKLKAKVNTKWLVEAKLYGLPDKTYRLNKLDYIFTAISKDMSSISQLVSEDPSYNLKDYFGFLLIIHCIIFRIFTCFI